MHSFPVSGSWYGFSRSVSAQRKPHNSARRVARSTATRNIRPISSSAVASMNCTASAGGPPLPLGRLRLLQFDAVARIPGDLALLYGRVERCPQRGEDAQLRRRPALARLAAHVALDLHVHRGDSGGALGRQLPVDPPDRGE